VFVFSEPDGAEGWFPSNDHPLDRATVRIAATVPAGMTVVSGGDGTSSQNPDGTSTFVWMMSDPVAPYLVPLAIGVFDSRAEAPAGPVPITTWYPAGMAGPELAPFTRQAGIIELLSAWFGPYPFGSAGALIVEDPALPAALETQTLPTYATASLVLGTEVIAHELTHQWFGDDVALARWSDIWLNEGFATFGQWLWVEHDTGPAGYDVRVREAYMQMSGLAAVANGMDPAEAAARARTAFPPPASPRGSDLFNPSVYLRGGLALVALRDQVGDTTMRRIMGTYASAFAGEAVTTDDFLGVVDDVAGSRAVRLVRSWIYDRAIPAMPERGLAPPA